MSVSVLKLSLDGAMKRAEKASRSVAIARASTERARANQTIARSELFPQVDAYASYLRTFKSQFDGLFETDATGGTGAFSDLPFGRRNTWQYGASLRQTLFAGGRTLALMRQANAGRTQAQIQLESTRADAVFGVAQAYLDAVLADRFAEIAQSALDQASRTLEQTRLQFELGNQPEFELLRARVAVDNQLADLVQRRVDRQLAYLTLKRLVGLPMSQELVLTTRLAEDPAESEAAAREPLPSVEQLENRAGVRQAMEAVRSRSAAVDVARSQHFPFLSLTSQYGRVAYPQDLFPSWSEFRTNFTAGLTLDIPIFRGFRFTGDVRSAEADLSEARTRLSEAKDFASYEAREARQQLRAAEAVWRSTGATVQQAERAYDLAEVRYNEGVTTQLEVTATRVELERARATRAQAAHAVQVARLRLRYLPKLPLPTQVATQPVIVNVPTTTTTQVVSPAAGTATGTPSTVGTTGAVPTGAVTGGAQ